MNFITDKQTLDDLNIFGKQGKNSVYNLFNNARTRGGAIILEEMFKYPLSGKDEINTRANSIKFFASNKIDFPYKNEWFDTIEHYLSNTDIRSMLSIDDNSIKNKIKSYVGGNTDYEQLHNGVLACINIIAETIEFIKKIEALSESYPFKSDVDVIRNIIEDDKLAWICDEKPTKKIVYEKMVNYDRSLRYDNNENIKKLLLHIYKIDVYMSVADVALKHNFAFGEAVNPRDNVLNVLGMFHPMVKNAVPNDIKIDENSNVIFLTGANMAGKSTFMKTFGIVVFLAHMGFPIPAKEMIFSPKKGMYTTINLPDNIGMGYSHFYAEVLRVKKVAEKISSTEDFFVIFDELFRGTNVKDAYDATIAVTQAFASKHMCTFMISTHIIEAGEELHKNCDNINYIFLPTIMQGSMPTYTYKIKHGITADRHGMMIINNEKITDILEHKNISEEPVNCFTTDKQTIDDLNLLGRYKPNSIFNIYNSTQTEGGLKCLEDIFQNPLNTVKAINKRANILEFFRNNIFDFPIPKDVIDIVEDYFSSVTNNNYLLSSLNTLKGMFMSSISADKEFEEMKKGIMASIKLLQLTDNFNYKLRTKLGSDVCKDISDEIIAILGDKKISWFRNIGDEISKSKISKYNYILRAEYRENIIRLLSIVYTFDAYISIAKSANENKMHKAIALECENHIDIKGLFHPSLPKAVSNDIFLDEMSNMIFLTGANMAGKSTLMKSFAIAIYTAHLGIPVAASSMNFGIMDGIYTSINVSDNLNMGYSHFYAEVMRVKNVAEEVRRGKRLLIVFDELFKGTNVKDAYDATLIITEAFSKHNKCSFMVSTHIVECGHELMTKCDNFRFLYLPTLMNGEKPIYTYKLKEGITSDRHGMMIINNENILDVLTK